MANVGDNTIIDSPLSKVGVAQAKLITGEYNLVICSPLRRTLETLHYSNISYDELIINDNIRERVQNITSAMIMENQFNFSPETDKEFWH